VIAYIYQKERSLFVIAYIYQKERSLFVIAYIYQKEKRIDASLFIDSTIEASGLGFAL
jgi:hypothetical protein